VKDSNFNHTKNRKRKGDDETLKVMVKDDLLEILKRIRPDENYNMDDLSYGRLFADVFKDVARYNTTSKS